MTDRKTDPDAVAFNRRVSELSKELSSLIKIAQAKGWDLSIDYKFQKEGSGGLYFHQGEWSSSTC